MNVFGHCTDPLPWTNPFPEKTGVILALRGGDYYSPDSWHAPTRATRDYFWRAVLPFFSARAGRFGFYIGWKVFGVDNESLRGFPLIQPEDVFVGSYAMQGFTWRFTKGLT